MSKFNSNSFLLEVLPLEKIEHRRFLLRTPELARSASATVSVMRTPRSWDHPERIQRTLYYFHSGGANDLQFKDVGAATALMDFDSRILDAFQVVCPAIENSFLVGSYEEWFEDRVRPWAEEGTQTGPHSRWIGGVSMGGFVALSKFLSQFQQYTGVIANAPGLLTWNFHNSKAAVSYCEESGLPMATVEFLAKFFAEAFKDQNAYDEHDPLKKIAELPQGALLDKSVYIDVGEFDDLGLRTSTEQLYRAFARFQVGRSHFETVVGGHHEPAFLTGQLGKVLDFVLND